MLQKWLNILKQRNSNIIKLLEDTLGFYIRRLILSLIFNRFVRAVNSKEKSVNEESDHNIKNDRNSQKC